MSQNSSSDVFRALVNPRRRRALKIIDDRPGIGKNSLAWSIANAEDGDGDLKQSIYVGLHNNHIDRLSDAGLIEHSNHEDLHLTEKGEEVLELIEEIEDLEVRKQ